MYLIDTNILLKYPSILSSYEDIVIHIRVLEELDGLKKNINPEVAYEARRASNKIKSYIEKMNFCFDRKDKLSVDDDLIRVSNKEGYELISNDINVQIKCRAKGVKYSGYDKIETTYTGVKYYIRPFDTNKYNENVAQILETMKPPFEMAENQFLIIQDANSKNIDENGEEQYDTVVILQYKKGKLEYVHSGNIKNDYMGNISPKNDEQTCLMSLLRDKNISILVAAGTYGTGKSYLLTNYALQELDKGHINKIVYVPNNSYNQDSRELGTLPGEMIDKELIHMGPVIDLVGEDKARDMVEHGLIEIVPISVMRGRSFSDSIIIANEAQNLTTDHAKLLIARCGRGTRIFFDGDVKQTDGIVFKNNSGLKLILHLANSPIFSKIFGTVKLKSIERSLTAQASAYLDDLLI